MFIGMVLLALAAIVSVTLLYRRRDRDGQWHAHVAATADPMMRRFVDGQWECRQMTDAEVADHQSHYAW